MAGQFAKPRTSNWETAPNGEKVVSYKGDSINGFAVSERRPDPQRLVQAYFHSVATANYLRAMVPLLLLTCLGFAFSGPASDPGTW